METVRKNQMEMLETIIERKIIFHGLISRLDTENEGISELEYRSIEIQQMEVQKKKWGKRGDQNIASKSFTH